MCEALYRHHQGHEVDRRPFPGRTRKDPGQGRPRRGRPRKSRPRTARTGERRRTIPAWRSGVSTSPRPRRSSSSAPRLTEKEAEAGEREARLMRWGLVPVWAKDLKVGYRMINAKTENLT